jgi:peptidyl-prolyl cis-trans isomerase D
MRSAAKWIWIFIVIFFVVGFLLLDTSGILGTSAITPATSVATVNGRDILYTAWVSRVQQASQQESERAGRALTLDETRRIEQRVLDQMIDEVLLEQEYRRRGIRLSVNEIQQAARYMPPPEVQQSPEFQIDGRFNMDKYLRFLSSPMAKERGILKSLEMYYRAELPKQKLFDQVAADVYVTDEQMWQAWQDVHDTAQVSYVAFTPDASKDSSLLVSDEEIRAHYEAHKKEFDRPGRAQVSLLTIRRLITAADTAAAKAKAESLRREIVGGAKFEDVAKRESADSVSAEQGGALPRGTKGQFVPAFENAAAALRVGQISEPVLTQFGYHIIKLDEKKGDTLAIRHILLRIQQSDSAAVRTDRVADSLQTLAGGSDSQHFMDAAKKLGIAPVQALAFEGEPLTVQGRYVASASAWAFSGAKAGETSELLDSEDAYTLARLDTLIPGGIPSLEDARDEIRNRLLRDKRVEAMVPAARALASAAVSSTLEAAAKAAGRVVVKSEPINRVEFVPGFGQGNRAIGAAFGLPVGTISEPIATNDAVYVLRVDRRVNASREEWAKQKTLQRMLLSQSARQERLQQFLLDLRTSAIIKDRRRELTAAGRRATS